MAVSTNSIPTKADKEKVINDNLADFSDIDAPELRTAVLEVLKGLYFESNLPDATKTPITVGGIEAGRTVASLKELPFSTILEDLLFKGKNSEGSGGSGIKILHDLEAVVEEEESDLVIYHFELKGEFYSVLLQFREDESPLLNKFTKIESVRGGHWRAIAKSPMIFRADFRAKGAEIVSHPFFEGHEVHEIRMTTATGDLRFLPDVSVRGYEINFGKKIFDEVIFEII